MLKKISSYELSEKADEDLENIFEYSEENHGKYQAIKYLEEIDHVFESLVANPRLGKGRDEIKAGLRSIPFEQHVIFYRILKDRIRMVRILHASRDVSNFL